MNFNIIELLKLPIKTVAAIMVGAGLILFLPNELMKKMHMDTFREKNGFLVGVAFIITVSILLVSIVAYSYNYLKKKCIAKSFDRNFKKNAKKILMDLSLAEKVVIMFLYEKPNHTLELPVDDGVVMCLKQKMMIVETVTQHITTFVNPKFPHMLQPWVINEMKKDGEMMGLFRKEIEDNEGLAKEIVKEIFAVELV